MGIIRLKRYEFFMFSISLKMIFRSWARNKIYFVISMLSLIIGLTCSVLLIGFVANEYNIAHVVKGGGQWYLLQEQNVYYSNEEVMANHTLNGGRAVAIQRSFPEVEDICVCHDDHKQIKKNSGETIPYAAIYAVTPNFADLFQPELLAGDLKETLRDPSGVAVTRSFARKNFGRENILGETLLLVGYSQYLKDGRLQNVEEEKVYMVKAIVDDKSKSYLQYDLLIHLPESDYALTRVSWMNSYYSFLKLGKEGRKDKLEKKLNQDETYRKQYDIQGKQQLRPLSQVYFSGDQQIGFIKSRDRVALYLAGSIAIAILVIACFNYINISMTKSLQRLKNTNQQMIFGATGQEIRGQLIAETSIQAAIALVIAVLLIKGCLPAFNRFMKADLVLSDLVEGISGGLMLILLVIVILGPSLYIFSRIGKNSLNDMMKTGLVQRPKLVTGMVVAQFVISVVLVVMVLGIAQQMDYVGHVRPDSDRILSLYANHPEGGQWKQFTGQLQVIPEVEDYTSSDILSYGAFSARGISAMIMGGDERFLPFFGLKLVKGKGFSPSAPNDAVLVNEAFVKKMAIQEPVNYRLVCNGEHLIVGVVEDFVIDNLSRQIQPLLIEYNSTSYNTLVKIKEGSMSVAIQKIKELWKKISGDEEGLKFRTMAGMYEDLHQEEQRVLQMVVLFSWISLFLTALGLFGLAWYSVESRMKEIGLRKINGATQRQVVGLLCIRFIKWIAIALAIGLPMALYLIEQWRMQYVFRPQLTVWIFIAAAFIVLAVGILTVIWQSWKAARVNPAKIIKMD